MTPSQSGKIKRIAIAVVGSGGSGVMTVGELLLRSAAEAGWYGMMRRSSGPQIRGGEAAAYVDLSTSPLESPCEYFNILLALDWKNVERFASEIALDKNSVVISGETGVEFPGMVTNSGAKVWDVDLKAMLKKT